MFIFDECSRQCKADMGEGRHYLVSYVSERIIHEEMEIPTQYLSCLKCLFRNTMGIPRSLQGTFLNPLRASTAFREPGTFSMKISLTSKRQFTFCRKSAILYFEPLPIALRSRRPNPLHTWHLEPRTGGDGWPIGASEPKSASISFSI